MQTIDFFSKLVVREHPEKYKMPLCSHYAVIQMIYSN